MPEIHNNEALQLALERVFIRSWQPTAPAARIDAGGGRFIVRATDHLDSVNAAFEALYRAPSQVLQTAVRLLAERALLAAIGRTIATATDGNPYHLACEARQQIIKSASVWAAHPPTCTWFEAAEVIALDLRRMAPDDNSDIPGELQHLAGLAIAWDASLR